MKWWWESLKQFFNFYPSEKRGVFIFMSTFLVLLLFYDHLKRTVFGDDQFQISDVITIQHYHHFDSLPCIDFNERLDTNRLKLYKISKYDQQRIIKHQEKYGAFHCLDDILELFSKKPYLQEYLQTYAKPEFSSCPTIYLNEFDAEEFSKYFRININKAKTLVKYRKSIGGFVKFEQLMLVYGFPKSKLTPSWKRRTKISKSEIVKFNLSRASYKTLMRHGFISRKSASRLNKIKKKRSLTLDDVRHEVKDLNKSLVDIYFKE